MDNFNKILIIRRDNIGDLVCTTPAITALRTHYPNAKIGALVNSYNAEVLSGNPDLDCVFVYKKFKHAGGLVSRLAALGQRIRLIVQLRCWKPDVTILAKASYDKHGLNFARLIGAPNIIGYVPEAECMAKSRPDICLKTPDFAAVHEVEAIAALLAPLGITAPMGSLRLFPDLSKAGAVHRSLPQAVHRIALHISAREPARRWGMENFVALANHILEAQRDVQVLLFWSPGRVDDPHHPGDDDVAAYLMKAVQSDRFIPMPTRNLTELISALSLCDLFIGADGGAMHLAVALNKKILALFENLPHKLNHWHPWQVKNQVVHSHDKNNPDVSNISLSQVMTAFKLLS